MGSFKDSAKAVIIFFPTLYFFSVLKACLQTLPHILSKQGAPITPISMPICPESLPLIHYLNNFYSWPSWSIPWMIKAKAPCFQLGRSCHFLWAVQINNSFSVSHCLLQVIFMWMCVGARSLMPGLVWGLLFGQAFKSPLLWTWSTLWICMNINLLYSFWWLLTVLGCPGSHSKWFWCCVGDS